MIEWTAERKAIVAALVVGAAAYGAGRFGAPAKVVEKIVTKDVVVERIDEAKTKQLEEALRDARTRLASFEASTHKETHVVAHPDGRVETKTIEDTHTATITKEVEVRYVDRVVKEREVRYVDRVVTHDVTVEKIIERDFPRWRIAAIAAASIPDALELDLARASSFGAAVQYRLAGPLSVGVWGLSSGQLGASVGLDF